MNLPGLFSRGHFKNIVFTGIGCCMMYTTGFIIINEYFDTRRARAMGLASLGTAAGAFVFPPVVQLLFDTYGFQVRDLTTFYPLPLLDGESLQNTLFAMHLLLKVNFQCSEALQRKHLISVALCLQSQMAAPLYCVHKGAEPCEVTYARGVVYFQSAMLSALLDSFLLRSMGHISLHAGPLSLQKW